MEDATGRQKLPSEDFNPATIGARNTQDKADGRTRDDSVSRIALTIKMVVMAGAIGALLFRWKAENAPLLLLVLGFSVGFWVSFRRRRT